MKNRKSNQLIAAGCMIILSAVNIYGSEAAYAGLKANAHGTPVDISSMSPDTYGVSYAWLNDGRYVVECTQEGFQSPVTVQVTFEEGGEEILQVEVVQQSETDGIGSQITDGSFAEQFGGVKAPVRVRDMEIISPMTKEVYGLHAGVERGAEKLSDPAEWNPEDQSVEAMTTRKLYEAGLLRSSIQKQELVTATADLSAEGKAQRRLYEAGLLNSSAEGELVTATVDLSAEEKAQRKLEEVGLSTKEKEPVGMDEAAAGGGAEVTEVDGISGATISSKAVGHAVDNAYFFVKEQLEK